MSAREITIEALGRLLRHERLTGMLGLLEADRPVRIPELQETYMRRLEELRLAARLEDGAWQVTARGLEVLEWHRRN